MLDLFQSLPCTLSYAGFFFISGYLIRRYIDSVPWGNCLDKRIWNIFWVLALWGVVQWLALSALNQWLAPERDLSNASNAAYADSTGEFLRGMITASTSLWYLYALIVYFVVCKIFSRLALPLFALFVLLSVAVNFVPTPWWGMNSVIRNLPYYSLGAWFGATLMTYVKEVPLRRHLLMASLLTVLAVGAWLFTISLLLSLVSIVVIMKLFYQYEQRFGMRSTSLLNVIGTNTIAIYTTHRILVEIFSLTLLAPMNAARWSPQVELTLDGLPLCQFVHLYCCGLAGKKTFTACIQRSVVLPAFTARCRQLLPLSHRPAGAIQFAKPCRLRIMNSIAYQRYAPYVEAYPNENLTTVMPEQYRYTLPVKAGEQRLLGELTGAACATLVAEIAERHAGPVVLIAPDMQNALRLHDEISQFTDQMVMNLADWETLPYDSFSPHQDIISSRLSTLYQLPTMQRGVLIVPVNTLMQRVCPHSFLHGHALVMKKVSACHEMHYEPNWTAPVIAMLTR